MGKNCNGFEEMDSTEKSIADVAAICLWLAPPWCSPVGNIDIVFNEILVYTAIAFNEISPILRSTNL